jgi:hypothetical protein
MTPKQKQFIADLRQQLGYDNNQMREHVATLFGEPKCDLDVEQASRLIDSLLIKKKIREAK